MLKVTHHISGFAIEGDYTNMIDLGNGVKLVKDYDGNLSTIYRLKFGHDALDIRVLGKFVDDPEYDMEEGAFGVSRWDFELRNEDFGRHASLLLVYENNEIVIREAYRDALYIQDFFSFEDRVRCERWFAVRFKGSHKIFGVYREYFNRGTNMFELEAII